MEKIEILIPAGAAKILRVLEDHGYEAYVVGGCVRDSLLGRNPHDWDITTSALPLQVKALFRRTIDTGLKHGTVTIMENGEPYEVTTYRVDGEYLDGRHPSEVTFTASLKEDLQRRDFTINAMAYSEKNGLQDFFGGLQDLKNKRIRAVGDPMKRFGEDALRIMRAVRFAAQLGYEIEEETVRAMKILAPTLSKVSAERISSELEKTLLSPHPEKLRMMYEAGITAVILPEFDRCMETPQNNPHHIYNVGEHTIVSIRNARRLKSDNATRCAVVKLVRFHDRAAGLTERSVRKMIREIGEDLFPLYLEVKEADTLAQSEYKRQEKLDYLADVRRIYRKILDEGDCLTLRDLAVNGSDLIEAGMEPGKQIGEVLGAMLEDVLEDPSHNEKGYLMDKYMPHSQGYPVKKRPGCDR